MSEWAITHHLTHHLPLLPHHLTSSTSRHDVFVIMPTGGGKSLCYQLPAMCLPGITIVVCPLVSLIQDQVSAMENQGVPAFQLSSTQSIDEQREVYDEMYSASADEIPGLLVYVTPERLSASGKLQNCLSSLARNRKLARFVIDEAHCVSQWGHDFRPDYKQLASLKHNFPSVPLVALTATATERVKLDVVSILKMHGPGGPASRCITFASSFNRPNLFYEVHKKQKGCTEDIARILLERHRNQTGIVYCCSKKDCEDVARKLNEKLGSRMACSHYHADMDPISRKDVQERWMRDELRVICATIAFGMGINKPGALGTRHTLALSLPLLSARSSLYRRPLRRPPLAAQEPRGVPPGDGARRARRPERQVLPVLHVGRQGEDRRDDRARRRRRRDEGGAAAQPDADDRVRRGRARVPPQDAAR